MGSALLPLLLSLAYFGSPTSSHFINPDFGIGLQPAPTFYSRFGYYVPETLRDRDFLNTFYHPWSALLRPETFGGISSISLTKESFKVILDVQEFKPEEVEVKVIENYLVIEAKHGEKKEEKDKELFANRLIRRYLIPDNVDAEKLNATMSSDGILTIEAPVRAMPEEKKERKIEIQLTGMPALKSAEKEKKDQDTTSSSTSKPEEQTTTGSDSNQDATTK